MDPCAWKPNQCPNGTGTSTGGQHEPSSPPGCGTHLRGCHRLALHGRFSSIFLLFPNLSSSPSRESSPAQPGGAEQVAKKERDGFPWQLPSPRRAAVTWASILRVASPCQTPPGPRWAGARASSLCPICAEADGQVRQDDKKHHHHHHLHHHQALFSLEAEVFSQSPRGGLAILFSPSERRAGLQLQHESMLFLASLISELREHCLRSRCSWDLRRLPG